MAKGHKPKAGSRAYWPRKRAKRIYPRFKHSKELERVVGGTKETKPLEFGGYKAGMTNVVFTDSRKGSHTQGQDLSKAVSVIDCPPLLVFGIKLYRKTHSGYETYGMAFAQDLKKDLIRKLDVPKKKGSDLSKFEGLERVADIRLLVHTQPREGFGKKKPEVLEVDLSGTLENKLNYAKEKLGKELDISEAFTEGEYVDVNAVTKGKGYQGVVKRFGVRIRSRKNKGKRRHIGTMGPVTPGRVLPGKIAQAGQLGLQTRTEFNKRLVRIGKEGLKVKGGFLRYGDVKKNYVLLEGSVPGPKKRLVLFRKSFRKTETKEPIEIKSVFLESQQ
ncbi:MAG: 50S ribosomal protein L3 [Candidatus Aenigmarchaeota archaeon]|nr:50S ribosomal protein L3 [Candidatus Aenigmarchaeota archaeon]NIP40332.1 50S ribosomal protein L3 [Candidatus Aenigmarchaeota archaeon]NIQ17826.1 50S ribosomal protein L3 [Candidatus Aenigmarchaeota archaeon]NIS73207.1 50S ribosomal protein L3 [Candidatus Aenigmarchaeota archaeon]